MIKIEEILAELKLFTSFYSTNNEEIYRISIFPNAQPPLAKLMPVVLLFYLNC
jgi:hypothetical protein